MSDKGKRTAILQRYVARKKKLQKLRLISMLAMLGSVFPAGLLTFSPEWLVKIGLWTPIIPIVVCSLLAFSIQFYSFGFGDAEKYLAPKTNSEIREGEKQPLY